MSAEDAATPVADQGAARRFDVAVLVGPGAELVDIAGPWGVFEYARSPSTGRSPFALSLVSSTTEPLVLSGGMRVIPDRTFAECEHPDIVVVPALGTPPGDALLDWLRAVHRSAAVTMSVCNGSFVVAAAGLLDGRTATCHHGAYRMMEVMFPAVTVARGLRWIDHGDVATAGGLTSGTDLALRVVERLLGAESAERATTELEHVGDGWRDPTVNAPFAIAAAPAPGVEVCPICEYAVDPAVAPSATRGARTFSFCGEWCRDRFLSSPAPTGGA